MTWLSDDCHTWEWLDPWMNVTWHECDMTWLWLLGVARSRKCESWHTKDQTYMFHSNVWPDSRMTVTHEKDLILDERDMTWMWLSGDSRLSDTWVMPHTHDSMYIFHSNVMWLSNDCNAWEDVINVTWHACDYWITLGSRIREWCDTYVNHATHTHTWVTPHIRLNVHVSL